MLGTSRTSFERLCHHRLDAASQFLQSEKQTREFTESIQGNHLDAEELKALRRRKLSFLSHVH